MLTVEQRDVAREAVRDALVYGTIGTVVSIPFLTWSVPKVRRGEWPGWSIPVLVTLASLVSRLLLHHALERTR